MSRHDGMVRDRAGDLVPDPDPPHSCRGGWLGSDAEPTPCPVCKPKTVELLRAEQRRADARRTYGEVR